jgi:hypothetical protein
VTTVGQEVIQSFGELSGKKSSQPIDGSSKSVWILPFAVGATGNAGAKPSIPSESRAPALISSRAYRGRQEQKIGPDRMLDSPDGASISMSNLTRGL